MLVFADDAGGFDAVPFFRLPGDLRKREDEDRTRSVQGAKEGHLTGMPSKTTDPKIIALEIAELHGLFGSEARAGASPAALLSDSHLAETTFGPRLGAQNVSADTVLSNLAAAARCVAPRSEMLASVPLFLSRRTAAASADENALYGVLHDLANSNQTAYEAREFMIRSLDLSGNA